MENIITVNNVTKTFGRDTVLHDVTVQFERGKIHGLVGRNGSGKTVLLKCICGFIAPTEGSIRVRNKVVGRDEQVPENLCGIIETPGFLPGYSGYSNLKFLASIQNKISRKQITDALDMVGLDPCCKKRVGKYSLGMRQRLGIAQAIMEDPEILILDEPMNGLDNRGVEDMRILFKRLRDEGKTILLASHNPSDIEMLCDTVSEMDAGVLTRM